MRKQLKTLQLVTESFDQLHFTLALSYGSRSEIVKSFKQINKRFIRGKYNYLFMKSKPVLIKEAILVDQEIETIDECLEISGKLLVDNEYIEPDPNMNLFLKILTSPNLYRYYQNYLYQNHVCVIILNKDYIVDSVLPRRHELGVCILHRQQ